MAGLPLYTRSAVGLWTLILIVLVMAVVIGATFAGMTGPLQDASLVAIIGFGVGALMGSPQMRPGERGGIGFAVGFIGTASGLVISVLVVVALDPEPLEIIPAFVAFVAGILGMVAGGACALGALLGGFLRGRRGTNAAIA